MDRARVNDKLNLSASSRRGSIPCFVVLSGACVLHRVLDVHMADAPIRRALFRSFVEDLMERQSELGCRLDYDTLKPEAALWSSDAPSIDTLYIVDSESSSDDVFRSEVSGVLTESLERETSMCAQHLPP